MALGIRVVGLQRLGDGSAWSETMDLVIFDGGNFPIVAFHCCLVIKESRSEFETGIKLIRILL